MKIKVLGTGCSKCHALEANAKQAVREAGLDIEIEKVTDLREIMKFQVLSTPGLVIDDQVKMTGRVPSVDEIKKMLATPQGTA